MGSMDHRNNPFRDWATVVDCGDVANTPFNKVEAVAQLTTGAKEILSRTAKSQANSSAVRMITIGGDHTISKRIGLQVILVLIKEAALPLLRATYPKWGPVAVLHFDSHLDTWDPRKMNGGEADKYSEITHGTMLHLAHEEGIISNNSNMHLGSRSMLFDKLGDLNNDARCGFDSIRAREIDSLGIDGIVQRVVDRVANQYVYVSIDIDVLDPAFAPGMCLFPWVVWKVLSLCLKPLVPLSLEVGLQGNCYSFYRGLPTRVSKSSVPILWS